MRKTSQHKVILQRPAGSNRMCGPDASADNTDAVMARGSHPVGPQALQPVRCSVRPSLICCRGVRAYLSAQACEKGRPRLRLHQSRGRTRSRQLLRHNRRVKSEPLRPRTAVWLPSLGCPLGRSLPWLPMGWGGLARVLRASPPVVVRPGSTRCRGSRFDSSCRSPRHSVSH